MLTYRFTAALICQATGNLAHGKLTISRITSFK